MIEDVLRHLDALVSFDTRNPPRLIDNGGIFDYIRAQLPDFAVTVHKALVGFIEVKAPGKGADPRKFDKDSHDGQQWD